MDKQTFKEQKELFLNYIEKEKNLSKNTYKSYNLDLNQYLYLWGQQELHENKNLNFDQMINKFNIILSNNNIDSSSIARKFSCINSFKKFLKKQGIETKSKLIRPRIQLKNPNYLKIEEIFNLLDSINSDNLPSRFPLRDRAIIEILYATGVRCSELVNIELNNLDLQNRSIIIRNKNQKERVVFYGTKAHKILTQYLETERTNAKNNYERLFLNYQNQPLTVRSIQRICKMFRSFLDNKFCLTPQALRHSFALHMIKKGASIDYMQELLGHKSKISTQRYLEDSLDNKNDNTYNND